MSLFARREKPAAAAVGIAPVPPPLLQARTCQACGNPTSAQQTLRVDHHEDGEVSVCVDRSACRQYAQLSGRYLGGASWR